MIASRVWAETAVDEPAIAAQGLVKRYRSRTALERFTLRVPEEAVYLLVGDNGAGKTTLMQTLLDLIQPDAGAATVLGFDCQREGHLVRAHIGYVPERVDIPHMSMTADALFAHHAVYYPAWDHGYAAELMTELGVRPRDQLRHLSKGELRRVQIVLALAHQPPVLLLDEPTDGLDMVARERFFSLLARHLATTPATVLLSTHHVAEAERLGTHVGIMRHGRLGVELRCEDMQRYLRHYRAEVPDAWRGAPALEHAAVRRECVGREIRWTIWGDEPAIVGQLSREGATVRDVSRVSIQEAAVALLSTPEEDGPWMLR
jgi:ABC-type multidrug transport system ATPase subunit